MAVIHGQYGTSGMSKALQLGVHASNWMILVHSDDQVDQNDYGDVTYEAFWGTGEMLAFHFLSSETGTGAVQTPAGTLMIFDDAVTVTAGDTAITSTERGALIGMVSVTADDWQSDANGASQYVCCTPIAFSKPLSQYHYFVWFHEDATSYNDAAEDDETLELKVWYRLDTRE